MSKPILPVLLMPILTVLAVLAPNVVFAAPADVPATGQTSCFDASGTQVDCRTGGQGQDGDGPAGAAWPNPRFVIGTGTEANCVTDRLTGLMWSRFAPPAGTVGDWYSGLSPFQSVCGFSDWRLPNVNELRSLLNFGVEDKAAWLNGQGFVGLSNNFFWTSTTVAANPNNAYTVNMDTGRVLNHIKTQALVRWQVRAGQ